MDEVEKMYFCKTVLFTLSKQGCAREQARAAAISPAMSEASGDAVEGSAEQVLRTEELRNRILYYSLPEKLAATPKYEWDIPGGPARFVRDSEQLAAYGAGTHLAVAKAWRAAVPQGGRYLLVIGRSTNTHCPNSGLPIPPEIVMGQGIHHRHGPLTFSRHDSPAEAARAAYARVASEGWEIPGGDWHVSTKYGVQDSYNTMVPAGAWTPESAFVNHVTKVLSDKEMPVFDAIGQGAKIAIWELPYMYDGMRLTCDRACESRRAGQYNEKKGKLSRIKCPCCLSKRCVAEYPTVPSKSLWFGTGSENVLLAGCSDAPIPPVPPGSKWCDRCEEHKNIVEDFRFSSNAVCAACDYDHSHLCDECAFDFISFCEGCGKCECTECENGQAGWNHMYGPSGAIGISCAQCKPWDDED